MKARTLTLLATLIAAPALADMQPVVPQTGFPTMMVPAMPGGYNPYMMMPYGMPQMPAMMPMPYGMPMQAMPYPMAPAMQAPAAAPAPAPAPAPIAAAPAPVVTPVMPSSNSFLSNLPPNPFTALLGGGADTAPKRPYEMRRVIEQPEKTQLIQMALPMMTGLMKMGMPDVMNYMARKYKAKEGLTFDDVRDSLFLRANQLNMKKVGENLMWMDFKAVLNDNDSPRIEVYSFCDIEVGRDLLRISPEFIVFLPCRIAIMEDADKNVWVLMQDWNMNWVAGYEKSLGIDDKLIQGAKSINDRMDEMMRAAANGDL